MRTCLATLEFIKSTWTWENKTLSAGAFLVSQNYVCCMWIWNFYRVYTTSYGWIITQSWKNSSYHFLSNLDIFIRDHIWSAVVVICWGCGSVHVPVFDDTLEEWAHQPEQSVWTHTQHLPTAERNHHWQRKPSPTIHIPSSSIPSLNNIGLWFFWWYGWW